MLLIEAIALGMGLNFIYYEVLGVVAGGLVTPGYIALAWEHPWQVLTTVLWGYITFLLMRIIAAQTILYGRRRFMLTLLCGFSVQWLVDTFTMQMTITTLQTDGIGYIIPGLLAHEMQRQGISATLLALLTVSSLVRLLLLCTGRIPIG